MNIKPPIQTTPGVPSDSKKNLIPHHPNRRYVNSPNAAQQANRKFENIVMQNL